MAIYDKICVFLMTDGTKLRFSLYPFRKWQLTFKNLKIRLVAAKVIRYDTKIYDGDTIQSRRSKGFVLR